MKHQNVSLLTALSLLMLWLWMPDAGAQTNRYVTAAGSGAGTGASWIDASNNLQAMIDASVSGDTVFVAAGEYKGGFFMKEGVQVYGGFTGAETYTSERAGAVDGANASILDGDDATRVLTQPKNFSTATVWDGFVIRNGSATKGAGAYLLKNGILRRCIVRDNQAGNPYPGELVPDQGGVVYRVTANQAFVMALTDASTGARTSAIGLTPIVGCSAAATHFEGKKETATIFGTDDSDAAAEVTAYSAPAPADGLTDWFLPAVGDWRLFVTECRTVGSKTPLCISVEKAMVAAGGSGFGTNRYWSATAFSVDNSNPDQSVVWYVNFGNGVVTNFDVVNDYRVRSVRAFNSLNYLIHSGGGVYAGAGSRVEGCLVAGNSAPYSAGVHLAGATGSDNEAVMTGSTVVNNKQQIAAPPPQPTYKIGDVYPKGAVDAAVEGVVFWVDETGEHGWIVNLKDDNAPNTFPWSPDPHGILPSYITTTTDRNAALADTAGWRNTQAIRDAYPGDTYAANQVDFDNGWYLPTAGQLRKLYGALPAVYKTFDALNNLNSGIAEKLSADLYWSSTAYNNCVVWYVDFANGVVNGVNVDAYYRVRSVRAF